MKFEFKIGAKIKEAWPTYKAHFYTFILLMVITGVVQVIGGRDNWLLVILSYLVGLILTFVWISFVLNLIDNKVSSPFSKEALPTIGKFWNLFKTVVLYTLCIIGGVILFVIPGFYVAGRLVFAVYLSVEKNQGARITIKEAWNMTKGYGWKLFWKSFVIGLFIAVGFIAFFIGIFITYPLGMIVMAMMYREFIKMKSQTPIDTVTTEAPKEVVNEVVSEISKETVTQ